MSALLATFAMLAAVTAPRTEKPVLVALGCDGRTAAVAEAEAAARGFAFQVQEDVSQEALERLLAGARPLCFCASGGAAAAALDFAAWHPASVAGIVAIDPAMADTPLRAADYPERFTMPVSIVGGDETAVEFARKVSFARPDLLYRDGDGKGEDAVRAALGGMFDRIAAAPPRFKDNTIRLAAINSSAPDRAAADFLCSGRDDEAVFNKAAELLPSGGTIVLSDGDYYFDNFTNEGCSAVCLGYNNGRARVMTFRGVTDNKGYNTRSGVGIHVTKRAMEAMGTNRCYRVFFGASRKPPRGDFGPFPTQSVFYTYTHVNNLRLENMQILFHDASKPLRGVDGSNFGSLYMSKVGIYTENYFRDRFMHVGRPDIPIEGTVGVWSVPSSNDEAADVGYSHVEAGGLHTGFVFNRCDKLVMVNCGACRCVQGYDFRAGAKTLTVINCSDEGNTYLPVFRNTRGKGGHVTMIDFNIERFNEKYIPVDPVPGRTEHGATEEVPGTWHGEITYTLQGSVFGLQDRAGGSSFWAPGHGSGFRTVDQNAERRDR